MAEKIPFVQVDTSGAPALDGVTDGAALSGAEEGLLIAGKDASNQAQFVKTGSDGAIAVTDNSGSLTVDSAQLPSALVDGRFSVDGSGVTQPVSAASLPLPIGAATAANQSTGNNSLSSIDTKITEVALDATLTGGLQKAIARGGAKGATAEADVTSTASGANHQALDVAIYDASGNRLGTATNPVRVDTTNNTAQAVTGTVNVMGGSTSALQTTGNTSVASIDTKTPALGQAVMASSSPVVIASNQSAVPVSGTVTATVTGVALDATLTGGTQKAIVRGGAKGTSAAADVTSTAEGADHQALDVQIYHGGTAKDPTQIRALASGTDTVTIVPSGTQTISGSVTATVSGVAQDSTLTGGTQRTKITDGTNNAAVKAASTAAVATDPAVVVAVSPNNTVAVSAASLPLPSGGATSALQTTGNTSLGNIDTKTPALVSGRVPVDGSAVTQPVSAASLPLPSGAATAANQPAVGTAGTPSADVLTVQGAASMTALKVDGSAVTQPVLVATATAAGTINASESLVLNLSGQSELRVDIQANTTALWIETTVDGTNWRWIAFRSVMGGTAAVTTNITSTSSIQYVAFVGGATAVRVRNTNASGSATLSMAATPGGTILDTVSVALDGTLTGGTQKSLLRGTAKGATAAADVTSTASGANHQPLDVAIYDASGNQVTSFGGEAVKGQVSFSTTTTTSISILGQSYTAIRLQVSGTFTGAIAPQASLDNSTWVNIIGFQSGQGVVNSLGGPVIATYMIAGYSFFRFNSTVATGTAVIDYTLNRGALYSAGGTAGTPYPIMSLADSAGTIMPSGATVSAALNTTPVDLVKGSISLSSATSTTILSPTSGLGASYNILRIRVSNTFTLSASVQGSVDGTNWDAIAGINTSLATVFVINASGQTLTYVISGYPYVRITVTSFTSGTITVDYALSRSALISYGGGNASPFGISSIGDSNGLAAITQANVATLPTDNALAVSLRPSNLNYYSASSTASSIAATPSDIVTISGHATKIVMITKFAMSTTQTTAGVNQWFLIKRSTVNTGGTATAATVVPHDSNYGAAGATVNMYTANPTGLGTAIGTARSFKLFASTPTTLEESFEWDLTAGQYSKGLTLRGISQMLCLNFNGAALPTGLSVSWHIEWVEY